MINYFTHTPDSTPNRNVPKEAQLIGRVSYASGEIVYDYYCLRYEPAHPTLGHWGLWKVCDWVNSKPQPTNFEEIKKVGLYK